MKPWSWKLLALLAILVTGGLIWHLSANQPKTVNLIFTASVGENPLVLNSVEYRNPNGQGVFKIRSFQFFISNIKLTATDSVYTEPESYHLVRFDNDTADYLLTLENVPAADYQSIAFGIGVDPAANASIDSPGELDPNGRMAWNWEVGYKFVLFEGGLTLDQGYIPLVYHIGFGENYKPLEFPIASTDKIALNVDILAMFTDVHPIDMATTSNVKFDRKESTQLAENYDGMITLEGK